MAPRRPAARRPRRGGWSRCPRCRPRRPGAADKFIAAQRKVIDRTKTLLNQGPEDLTRDEEKILGDLAREEAKWAAFFEEKLTAFSKLPLQDFADGSLAKEVNEVFMEVKQAAKSLYEQRMEMAVPQEQSGLENARPHQVEHGGAAGAGRYRGRGTAL